MSGGTGHRIVPMLTVVAVLAGVLGVAVKGALADGPEGAAGVVGSFEIDGNSAQDSLPAAEPIDWDTPPPNLTEFQDASGSKDDDSFGGGSKNLEPGNWNCQTGAVPGKNDIVEGAVAFRTLVIDGEEQQFVYARWLRLTTNGDANVDYEFNRSTEPNPACPDHPKRTDGDLLITFDTDQGGKSITVRAWEWRFTDAAETVGVFEALPVGSKHETWDAAVNIPPELSDPDVAPGAFGELALNLTRTVGTIECGEFTSAFIKTRASTSINAALKDRTQSEQIAPGDCPPPQEPELEVAKVAHQSVVTAGNDIGFTITVSNVGEGTATGVTLTDALPGSTEFGIDWQIDPAVEGCDITGDPPTQTLECSFGDLAPGGSVSVSVTSSTTQPAECEETTLINSAQAQATNHPPVESGSETITLVCEPEPPECPPTALATASGSTVLVEIDDQDPLTTAHVHLGHMATSQTGVGSSEDSDEVAIADLLDGTVWARALHTSLASTVTEDLAHQFSTARGADVGILCDDAADLDTCLLSFEVAAAVATAQAGPDGASTSTDGSTLVNVKFMGESVADIGENFTIDLSPIFGPGSRIVLMEEESSTSFTPADPDRPEECGGVHSAEVRMTLVRVVITDKLPVIPDDQGPLDIRLFEATASATYDARP